MSYALLLWGGTVVAQADYAAPETSPFNLNGTQYSRTPTFVDLDNDGDIDMLTLFGGALRYAENNGTINDPLFATAVSLGLSIGQPAAEDFDNDGDYDLIYLSQTGTFLYSENIGSATTFNFDAIQINPYGLSTDELPTPNDTRSATPIIADIDADGDLDVFVQSQYKDDFIYFENTGNINTPNFEDPVINPFGANTDSFYPQLCLGDFDRDGDLDLLATQFAGGPFRYQENIGTPENPDFSANTQISPFNLPTEYFYFYTSFPIDFDDDGDLDVMIASYFGGYGGGIESDVIVYIENKEIDISCGEVEFNGPFVNQFGINNFSNSEVNQAFGDLDDDGDLDMLVCYYYYYQNSIQFQENVGSATNPSFAPRQPNPFGIITPQQDFYIRHIELVDLDGDLDLDIIVGSASGGETFKYYENIGDPQNPAFALFTSDPFGLDYPASPLQDFSFADLDNDGDLDLISGELSGNNDINYFENIGTTTAPMFDTRIITPFGLSAVGTKPSPEFIDMDGDGDFDVIMGNQAGDFYYVENIGTPESPSFTTPIMNPFGFSDVGSQSSPAVVDIDGDGDGDVFSKSGNGTYSDGWRFFENDSEEANFTITGGDFEISVDQSGTVTLEPLQVIVAGNCLDSNDITSAIVAPNQFDCDDVGTTFEVAIAFDYNGETITVTSNVLITDTVLPLVEDLPDVTLTAAQGENTIMLPDFTIGVSATDNCSTFPPPNAGEGIFTQSQAPGTVVNVPGIITNFAVIATDANGNEGRSLFDITLELSLGTSESALASQIKLVPNPAIDSVDLMCDGAMLFSEIAIKDLVGKKIRTFANLNNSNTNTLSLVGIPSGFYIVQIEAENEVVTKKLIIQ